VFDVQEVGTVLNGRSPTSWFVLYNSDIIIIG